VQYGYVDSAGFNDSVWAINLDGTGETFITEGAHPRVSRDGQWLAFLREGGGVLSHGNLWIRNLETGAETRFYTNTDAIMGFDWNSPQPELVFDNNCLLWRQTIGGPVTQLPVALTPECYDGAPVVNPVDARLAFHNVNPSGPQGVYVAPALWSSRARLTELSTLRWRWPSWSFDGSQLAMADQPSQLYVNTGVNLWTIHADGSNARQVTALSGADGFPRGAIWTPSGRTLVGAGVIGGVNGLWVIPLAADGGACHCPPLRLPTSPGSDIEFAGSVLTAPAQAVGPRPGLFIRTEPSAVVVYWSTNYDGYSLEYATSLSASNEWQAITGPYFLANGYYEYREPKSALAAEKFFRLHYPGVFYLTPSEPTLSLTLSANQAVLMWPGDYTGYTLEVTTNLAPPVIWVPQAAAFNPTNGYFEFRRDLIGGKPQEYFRLHGP
jgi:hypothetical protein